MSIREDWMKLAGDLHEVASAFRAAVGFARQSKPEEKIKPRNGLLVTVNGKALSDLSVQARLEASKNLSLVHHVRNQLR